MPEDLQTALDEIRTADGRYREEAYYFLLEALGLTVKALETPRHVNGPELLEGIRRLASSRFGLTARLVFEHWGVRTTEDFGRIVFQLVERGVLSKTDADSIADFADVYDFKTVFEDRYAWTAD
ncbi:MAG: hypothetical protein EHM19_05495 [Candidatus Latescibacterota bacterium]|nr:MAG: hypothetical protein EHM19_05495 [Candidatus Latescibacterota bacterium]